MIYKRYIKRIIDLVFSLAALPFVCVVILVCAPFIYLEDRGPVFYLAKRRGLNGKIFEMYKLRSMKVNAPDLRNSNNSTYSAPNDPRITKVGKVLRKTSIDELPQVFNILKGDMSWVGPRPITINRPLEDYDEKRKTRLTVRPGITGYSQAYFRNSIGQEEKLQYDADYAKSVCFIGDLKIVIKTVFTILQRKNVYRTEQRKEELHEVK